MVPQNEITPVRIKFSKTGDLMYISHLDLSRTMQRIMLRAGIDIWYSEGFNPQPKIVFAVPLPVGVESECELMDIKINSPMPFEEIKERIQDNFPSEMKVLDVYSPTQKFKNIGFIDYTVRLYTNASSEETCGKIEKLFKSECNIIKKTKSGEKEINISDYVKFAEAKNKASYIEIHAILSADSERYLNPELFIEAIKQNVNIMNSDGIEEYSTVYRNKMLDFDLNEFV